MPERKPQINPIERALIDKAATLKRPVELIDEVKEKGFKESDIRGSIWSLIARGELNLDADRNLQAGSKHSHQLYLMPPTNN